mmetsp:Transcript_14238/g.40774  ORF Transcript_14238/g.40774 Transcript_14238/m.40774 type:complete len:389 (+) Transcript_14238:92-1258(+)
MLSMPSSDSTASGPGCLIRGLGRSIVHRGVDRDGVLHDVDAVHVHVAKQALRQLLVLHALDEEAVMNLGPRQHTPEGAQHLPRQDVEAANIHAYLKPLAGRILHNVATLGNENGLAIVGVEHIRHVHVRGVLALRDGLEETHLLVLLLALLDPVEEAPVRIARGAVGQAGGASAEGLKKLDTGWTSPAPLGMDGLRLNVENSHKAATRILLEGVQAGLVRQHHVDDDYSRQGAVRRPLECVAAAAVALAVLVRRRRQLLHIITHDVLNLDRGPDRIAAQSLVHAGRALHLGPGLLVVWTTTDLEPVAVAALAPVGPSARLGQLLVDPLRDGAARPRRGFRALARGGRPAVRRLRARQRLRGRRDADLELLGGVGCLLLHREGRKLGKH